MNNMIFACFYINIITVKICRAFWEFIAAPILIPAIPTSEFHRALLNRYLF